MVTTRTATRDDIAVHQLEGLCSVGDGAGVIEMGGLVIALTNEYGTAIVVDDRFRAMQSELELLAHNAFELIAVAS